VRTIVKTCFTSVGSQEAARKVERQSESVLPISPIAADTTSMAPNRFTVAMTAPAMMSGQPDFVSAINAAATIGTVKVKDEIKVEFDIALVK
jgi:hypothetical protein